MSKTKKDLFFAVLENQGPLKRVEFEQQILPKVQRSPMWERFVKDWEVELSDEEFARRLKQRLEMLKYFNVPKSPPWFDPKN